MRGNATLFTQAAPNFVASGYRWPGHALFLHASVAHVVSAPREGFLLYFGGRSGKDSPRPPVQATAASFVNSLGIGSSACGMLSAGTLRWLLLLLLSSFYDDAISIHLYVFSTLCSTQPTLPSSCFSSLYIEAPSRNTMGLKFY